VTSDDPEDAAAGVGGLCDDMDTGEDDMAGAATPVVGMDTIDDVERRNGDIIPAGLDEPPEPKRTRFT
jgi:hypothetical protein